MIIINFPKFIVVTDARLHCLGPISESTNFTSGQARVPGVHGPPAGWHESLVDLLFASFLVLAAGTGGTGNAGEVAQIVNARNELVYRAATMPGRL